MEKVEAFKSLNGRVYENQDDASDADVCFCDEQKRAALRALVSNHHARNGWTPSDVVDFLEKHAEDASDIVQEWDSKKPERPEDINV